MSCTFGTSLVTKELFWLGKQSPGQNQRQVRNLACSLSSSLKILCSSMFKMFYTPARRIRGHYSCICTYMQAPACTAYMSCLDLAFAGSTLSYPAWALKQPGDQPHSGTSLVIWRNALMRSSTETELHSHLRSSVAAAGPQAGCCTDAALGALPDAACLAHQVRHTVGFYLQGLIEIDLCEPCWLS